MTFNWGSFKSEVWKPTKVGDSITGLVVDVEVRKGRSGDVPVVTLQLEDNSHREVWASPVDLRQKLADCRAAAR